MNEEIILDLINNNKLKELTEKKIIYILNHENLKKELIKKLEETKEYPKEWDNFSIKTISEIRKNHKELIDLITYNTLINKKAKSFPEYLEILITTSKTLNNNYPKTQKKLLEDTKIYYNEIIKKLDIIDAFQINNPIIIDYIIKEKKEPLFKKCNYNNYKFQENQIEEVLNMIYKSPDFDFYVISNPQLVDYIFSKNYNILYKIINYNIITFKEDQIEKFLNEVQRRKMHVAISNPQLVDYILSNNKKSLYLSIDYNFLKPKEEQLPQIIEIYKDLSEYFIYSKKNIKNLFIIDYIINNNEKKLYKLIDINNVTFKEEQIPKIIEIVKKTRQLTEISNPQLVDYIILNEEKYLYMRIYKFNENNNLNFDKETIYKLLKIKKENPIFIMNIPIINYLSTKKEEEIDKFIDLIKVRKISLSDIKNINESLQQALYRQENPKEVKIFNNIKSIAENKDISIQEKKDYITKWVNMFLHVDCIPNYLIKDLREKNTELNFPKKKELFLTLILEQIVINNIYQPYLDILHEITNNYVAKKANDFSNKNNIDSLENIEFNYDIESNRREVTRKIFNYLNKNNKNLLLKIVKENGYLYDKIEGKKFKLAREIFLKWLDDTCKKEGNSSLLPQSLQYLFDEDDFTSNLKKEVKYKKRQNKLKEVNEFFTKKELDVIFEDIINNKQKYQKILEILNKYKLLDWSPIFDDVIMKLYGEVFYSYHSFITNFNSIYESNKEKYISEFINSENYNVLLDQMTKEVTSKSNNLDIKEPELKSIIKKELIKTIEESFKTRPYQLLNDFNVYESHNIIYKIILGIEEYKLIKKNPPENRAIKLDKESYLEFTEHRLKQTATDYLDMLLYNQKVTTPSLNQIITTKTGKKIRVIVGNRTKSINMILGELTDSCMRTRGIAESLFRFCNNDPRGLHILFEDPNTGKLISRISGFRNGNTLFLNQLRHSLSPNYEDEDLVDALKNISNTIIKKSNESEEPQELPIKNIIADSKYALSNEEKIAPPFKKEDISMLNYIDIGDREIVALGTTSKDKNLAPIELKEDNQHLYDAQRPEPVFINKYDELISNKIKRIEIIKECQERNNIEIFKELEIDKNDINYKKAIISDDWVTYIDEYDNIITINASKDSRANIEIKEAKALLEKELKHNYPEKRLKHGKTNA